MKLATTTGDLISRGDAPELIAERFEQTGFRYLDYSFYGDIYPGSPLLSDSWREYYLRAKTAAEGRGMRFVQAHAPDYNPLAPDETGMLAMRRSVEACAILGVENIVTHSGHSKSYLYPDGRDAYFEANAGYYRELLKTADRCGVNILIENSAERNMGGKYFFMTGREMRDFIGYIGNPRLFACWDTGHANMRGVNQYDDITELGEYLRALHVQDNYGTYDEHIAPFMGTLNPDALMQALIKTGYRGYFTFEAGNILRNPNAWPHYRNKWENPDGTANRLPSVPLALKIKAVSLLFDIGNYILGQYGLNEG